MTKLEKLLRHAEIVDADRARIRAEIVQEIKNLHTAGYSMYRLAQMTGYSAPTIKKMIHE